MRAKLRAEYISLNHILYVSHNTYNKENEVNFIFLFLSILFVSWLMASYYTDIINEWG